jgi:hypothetical protein
LGKPPDRLTLPAPEAKETKSVVHGQRKKVCLLHYCADRAESALFAGLEAVQGPNWAAILQLYGPGGSISEALKDRSQVQLKDKARNLKLFFLKGGHEVPRVLERVTGRLKGEQGADGMETPLRRKRRRTVDAATSAEVFAGSSETAQEFAEGQEWQSNQGQDFAMGGVVGNVDPGLQMPQTG